MHRAYTKAQSISMLLDLQVKSEFSFVWKQSSFLIACKPFEKEHIPNQQSTLVAFALHNNSYYFPFTFPSMKFTKCLDSCVAYIFDVSGSTVLLLPHQEAHVNSN